MPAPPRFTPRAWMFAAVAAAAQILWADVSRIHRLERLSGFERARARLDANSPSGYEGGKRWLIVPGHDNPTYQWIGETQAMAAKGDWRLRRVDHENAPFGRQTPAASPYRWWLILVAYPIRLASGDPLAACIERAALWADPILHLLVLAGATLLALRRFGKSAGVAIPLGLAAVFPVAGAFVPGVANDFALGQVFVFAGVALLGSGILADRPGNWFLAAGIAGGCGLWLSAGAEVPVLLGLGLGGALAAPLRGGDDRGSPARIPWLAWAVAGAVTSLAAYGFEYFPDSLDAEPRHNYPVYGLAWLGLGLVLDQLYTRRVGGRLRRLSGWAAGLVALAALPLLLWRLGSGGFLSDDLLSQRVTNLSGGVSAEGTRAWFSLGHGAAAAAAGMAVALPCLWLLAKPTTSPRHRMALALALGPLAVSVGFAFWRIRWWNTVDLMLLSMALPGAAALDALARPGLPRWIAGAVAAVAAAFGLPQLLPPSQPHGGVEVLSRDELEEGYERLIAHAIADHAGPDGATVLAPPYRTSSLCYYGGLRGLGTQNWDNKDGLDATFKIATAVTQDEARAVMSQRGVTWIAMPSWDRDLEEFARLRLKDPSLGFASVLRRSHGGLFSWLRAFPMNLPPVAGFDDGSVLLLQVTDEANPATVRGRLVEYLIESRQFDAAAAAAGILAQYPTDLGALAAQAQLAAARADAPRFARALHSILSVVDRDGDRSVAWDRRVSVATVLAVAGEAERAKRQVGLCLAQADPERIRFLTPESLYHLLVLAKRYGVTFADPSLGSLARDLLPAPLAERL